MQARDAERLWRALAAVQAEQFAEAAAQVAAVLDAGVDTPDAHLLAALAARGEGRGEDALAAIDRAILRAPDLPDLHAHRGVILSGLDRLHGAERAFARAVRLLPNDPHHLADLGRIQLRRRRFERAFATLTSACDLRPDDAALVSDLAVALCGLRRPDEAVLHLDRAVTLEPEHAEYRANRSRARLLAGRYAEGFADNEARWRTKAYAHSPPLPHPVWRGEEVADARVLVVAEQGLGDTLQLVRYAPRLRDRGAATVHIVCQPELVRLLDAMPGVDGATSIHEPWPQADVCAPVFGLPLAFGTTLETVPADVPYLRVPRCGELLRAPRTEALCAGLVWTGKTNRTLDLEQLEPVLEIPDIAWVNLQVGPLAAEARTRGLADPTPELRDFADTATLLTQLDVVITVDTAVAHLAGALGLPTLVLLHAGADWRWTNEGATTPWYPRARLFRQRPDGPWREPIEALAAALATLPPREDRRDAPDAPDARAQAPSRRPASSAT
ncbi:MAG: tetratricopeptide repeat protein [Planctomycetota bacterium]